MERKVNEEKMVEERQKRKKEVEKKLEFRK